MGFSSTRNGPNKPVSLLRRQGGTAAGEKESGLILPEAHVNSTQTIDVTFHMTPRERLILLESQSVDAQWSVTMNRAFRALELLERRGYDIATFLTTVLKAVNEVLEQQPCPPMVQGEAYDRAVTALRRAQRHDPLRNLIRAQKVMRPDAACLLLKRAVTEVEAVMRSVATLDLSDSSNITAVRRRATDVILSVLGAEVQASLEKL